MDQPEKPKLDDDLMRAIQNEVSSQLKRAHRKSSVASKPFIPGFYMPFGSTAELLKWFGENPQYRYMLEDNRKKEITEDMIIVPRQFAISTHYTTLTDLHDKPKKDGPQKLRGRTQPYAVLLLLAEKYRKRKQIHGDVERIELSIEEIAKVIGTKSKPSPLCNHPLRDDDDRLPKFIAQDIADNITRLIRFNRLGHKELLVVESKGSIRLVLRNM